MPAGSQCGVSLRSALQCAAAAISAWVDPERPRRPRVAGQLGDVAWVGEHVGDVAEAAVVAAGEAAHEFERLTDVHAVQLSDGSLGLLDDNPTVQRPCSCSASMFQRRVARYCSSPLVATCPKACTHRQRVHGTETGGDRTRRELRPATAGHPESALITSVPGAVVIAVVRGAGNEPVQPAIGLPSPQDDTTHQRSTRPEQVGRHEVPMRAHGWRESLHFRYGGPPPREAGPYRSAPVLGHERALERVARA